MMLPVAVIAMQKEERRRRYFICHVHTVMSSETSYLQPLVHVDQIQVLITAFVRGHGLEINPLNKCFLHLRACVASHCLRKERSTNTSSGGCRRYIFQGWGMTLHFSTGLSVASDDVTERISQTAAYLWKTNIYARWDHYMADTVFNEVH